MTNDYKYYLAVQRNEKGRFYNTKLYKVHKSLDIKKYLQPYEEATRICESEYECLDSIWKFEINPDPNKDLKNEHSISLTTALLGVACFHWALHKRRKIFGRGNAA